MSFRTARVKGTRDASRILEFTVRYCEYCGRGWTGRSRLKWGPHDPQETCAALNCCCAKWTMEPYFIDHISLV
jgi:hypothetical protein